MSTKIREYWDARARENTDRPAATTRDVYLRELEIATLTDMLRGLGLRPGARVLDVGCGDGYSTVKLAEAFPNAVFEGFDFSESMVAAAQKRLVERQSLKDRASFRVGDATRIHETCGDTLYDVIMTDRCLINLDTPEKQYDSIRQISEQLKPGGYYVAIENFIEGHNNMNEARAAMGLNEIPVRWHNLYFREAEFLERTRLFFDTVELREFSSAYYYATRVLYSSMCKQDGVEPDYEHQIHQLATSLPWFGTFSPVRMVVLHKPVEAVAKPLQIDGFETEKKLNMLRLGGDRRLCEASIQWIADVSKHRYSYNFSWLGRPIIQFPQDIVAVQELIWKVKPDLIVETGIAHGGSIIFSASMLELLGGDGQVVGIDIDIREHNRVEIEKHPMFKRITMIEGSSVDDGVVAKVRKLVSGRKAVMVLLDSMHTHDHVLRELELYSPLVTRGSYLVVFDTAIEDVPDDLFADRPWGKGNNPKTAVREFLKTTDRFEIDEDIPNKLLITVAPDGYLKCVKD